MNHYTHNISQTKPRRRAKIITVMSLLAVVAGLVLMFTSGKNHQPIPPSGSEILPTPSSTKPSSSKINNYQVAADLPRYIFIPSIGVTKTRVFQLGLNKKNQIASPDNIYDVGWYKDSAKPGKDGAMFMYGHVSSWTANGIFYDLKKLKPGDEIIIQRGDGQKFTYQVRQQKTYQVKNVDMQAALKPIEAGRQGLNLMTCTGSVIPGTSEFDQRLVVFASRI